MRRLALAAVLLAACGPGQPPGAAPPTAGPAAPPAFDGAVLLADVAVLAHDSMEGRRTGTPGGLRARRWLEARFAALGLRPPAGGYVVPFHWVEGRDTVRGANVVGLVPGTTASGRVLVVTAHYDHLGVRDGNIYNGADDNASGVAALLAVAGRVAQAPLAATVVFAALDAEEQGLEGARAFVRDPPVERARIAFVLNLDMVGRNADGELWVAGTSHYPGFRALVDTLARTSPLSIRLGHDRPGVPGRDDWTGSSDHAAFHAAGIPFLYLGEEDHPDYHRPTDDTERIQPAFLAAAADLAWGLLAGVAGDAAPVP